MSGVDRPWGVALIAAAAGFAAALGGADPTGRPAVDFWLVALAGAAVAGAAAWAPWWAASGAAAIAAATSLDPVVALRYE